ncbi:hypothetical protein Bca52824_058186 [Brassica carinata]|uniref:Uncharacterized protein n=1 Tax=Brassica carinata TaxID=52824 RepID=A0A8X7UGX0_BRACI|nr:hypothetical protein Bca52824_058186 [Brassica carinata]
MAEEVVVEEVVTVLRKWWTTTDAGSHGYPAAAFGLSRFDGCDGGGNPTLQRALAERRAALGMSQPDPEAGTSTDPNPSANYFDDDDVGL